MKKTIAIGVMVLAVLFMVMASGCGEGAGSHVAKGNADMLSKNYISAVKNYDRALKIDPKNVEALFQRGRAYYFQGKFKEATSDFKKVMELDAKSEKGQKAKQMLNKIEQSK